MILDQPVVLHERRHCSAIPCLDDKIVAIEIGSDQGNKQITLHECATIRAHAGEVDVSSNRTTVLDSGQGCGQNPRRLLQTHHIRACAFSVINALLATSASLKGNFLPPASCQVSCPLPAINMTSPL